MDVETLLKSWYISVCFDSLFHFLEEFTSYSILACLSNRSLLVFACVKNIILSVSVSDGSTVRSTQFFHNVASSRKCLSCQGFIGKYIYITYIYIHIVYKISHVF